MSGDSSEAVSFDAARAAIVEPLIGDGGVVQEVYAYVQEAVPDPVTEGDDAYQAGLFAAVEALTCYCLEAIRHGPGYSEQVPIEAVRQARRAACAEVGPTTVVRRFIAGHRRLGELVIEQAARVGLSGDGPAMLHLRKVQEALLEELVARVTREYEQEREQLAQRSELRLGMVVRKLLDGGSVSRSELGALRYQIYGRWHLGIVALGEDVEEAFGRLQARLDCEFLNVGGDGGSVLLWVGARRQLDLAEVEQLLMCGGSTEASFGAGGWGWDLEGWRQTHREADRALLWAQHRTARIVRYADKPLLVAALENDTLRCWLRELLAPVRDHAEGVLLMRTLRAYIEAEWNFGSAAAMLGGVRRQTVSSRVRVAEQLLGRPIRTCLGELDVALSLEELAGLK